MNTILLKNSEIFTDNKVILVGKRFNHIVSIIKPSLGETLSIGILDNNLGTAEVTDQGDSSITLTITDLSTPPPPPMNAVLICALPRPKMFRRVLHMAIVSGVKEIYFINTKRVEQSFWQSSVISKTSCETIIFEALSQTEDTRIPHIYFHHRFDPFVECYIPQLIKKAQPILFHPTSAGTFLPKATERYLLIIGPEGGFIEYEIEKLSNLGCQLYSMGPRILQVEQAVSAILGHMILSIA